ncbi:MAG TPA: LuxR C-terminal-related transcriptional regulator, partial [Thauera sp.]|nr:LuxR C-terminal-related transcriptional regulator [Thauera sp.]HNS92803.1 LuxR C-terminal-related transcriptional regulator [Thauera sp.]
VAEGKHFLCAEATARMLNRFLPRADSCPPVSLLSQREREVLVLLANGKRAAEMAAEMGITVSTVEVHRRHLKDKLGLRTSADLTRYAIREGLVAP